MTIIQPKKKLTTSKEDYLKAIWSLSERSAEGKSETGTNDLSALLGGSPPAVSRMLKCGKSICFEEADRMAR